MAGSTHQRPAGRRILPAIPVQNLSRYLAWYWPTIGLALTAVLAASATLLSFTPACNAWCDRQPFACSLVTNALVVLVVAGSSFYYLFGYRRNRLLRAYRDALRRQAGSPALAAAGDPAARSAQLHIAVRHVLRRDQIVTVVLTGYRGEGKSTALRRAAVLLTTTWRIPVLLDPSAPPGQLLTTLRDNVAELLAARVRTDTEFDAFWRLLLRCDRIVVLIDGLDEVPVRTAESRRRAIMSLINAARSFRIPIFATAEPDSLARIPVLLMPLPALSPRDVRDFLRQGSPDTDEGALKRVAANLPDELNSPFYLSLIAEQLSSGDITAPVAGMAGRVAVLHRWLERTKVEHRAIRRGGPDLIQALAVYALAATKESAQAGSDVESGAAYREIRLRTQQTGQLTPQLIEDGIALRLLDAGSSVERPRFRHSLIQAFLGAGLLAENPSLVPYLVEARANALVRTTILFAEVLEGSRQGACPVTVRGQVALAAARSTGAEKVELMSTLVTAFGTQVPQVINSLTGSLHDTPFDIAKRGIDAVDSLPGHLRTGSLWAICRGTPFSTRLEAALRLAESGACDERLLRQYDRSLSRLEAAIASGGQLRTWHYALALWLVPSAFEERRNAATTDLLARGIAVATSDLDPSNFEFSLSRGFKIAAWARRSAAIDPALLTFATKPVRHWFSRMNLMHAISLRLATEQRPRAHPAWPVLQRMRDDPHPLMREASRLAIGALEEGVDIERVVWFSESDAMSRSEVAYTDETWRLLGDVYLAWNLANLVRPRIRVSDDRTMMAELPPCISSSPTRSELFEGCSQDCGLRFCPYPFTRFTGQDRGDVSPYFCQVQVDVLTRIGRGRWQHDISRGRLREFWQQVEERINE